MRIMVMDGQGGGGRQLGDYIKEAVEKIAGEV